MTELLWPITSSRAPHALSFLPSPLMPLKQAAFLFAADLVQGESRELSFSVAAAPWFDRRQVDFVFSGRSLPAVVQSMSE